MNTFLWILQLLLCVAFLYSGVMKSTQKRERLVAIGQTAMDELSYPLIRCIGLIEISGAIGIVLPEKTQVLPVLTPITAVGFALIMILAAPIHYKRRETQSLIVNIILFVASVLVAAFRFTDPGN